MARNNYNNYNGMKFGEWIVGQLAETKLYKYPSRTVRAPFVYATCSCGNKEVIRLYTITKGASTRCKSCAGVASGTRLPRRRRAENGRWNGEGAIPGRLISQIRAGARTRGIAYELPDGFLSAQWDLQKGRCALSGVELVIPPSKTKGTDSDVRARFASLDRIDSTGGYTPGNVQWVSKVVNLMKHSMPQAELLSWVERIHKYQNEVR